MIKSNKSKELAKAIFEKMELKGYTLVKNTDRFKAYIEKGIRVSKSIPPKGNDIYCVFDAVAKTDYYEITNKFLLRLILENV